MLHDFQHFNVVLHNVFKKTSYYQPKNILFDLHYSLHFLVMQPVHRFTSILFFIILSSATNAFAISEDAANFIESARKKIERKKDFSTDATIIINVDFVKVPVSKVKVYFRRPDKVAVKSEGGFAMLPKQGFGLPSALFQNDYATVFIKRENINGVSNVVIKTIPLKENDETLLTTLWINERDSSISRIIYATNHGNITVDFEYNANISSLGLPAKSLIKFELPTFILPKTLTGDLNSGNKPKPIANELVKGTATVIYSTYIVNKGVPDAVFSSKK